MNFHSTFNIIIVPGNITNLQAPSSLSYVVSDFREGDNYKQNYSFNSLSDAKTAALNFVSSSSPIYSNVLIYDVSRNNYYVESGMKIQDAINNAPTDSTINVAAGTYAETLTIDQSLTLLGAQSGVDAIPVTPMSLRILNYII